MIHIYTDPAALSLPRPQIPAAPRHPGEELGMASRTHPTPSWTVCLLLSCAFLAQQCAGLAFVTSPAGLKDERSGAGAVSQGREPDVVTVHASQEALSAQRPFFTNPAAHSRHLRHEAAILPHLSAWPRWRCRRRPRLPARPGRTGGGGRDERTGRKCYILLWCPMPRWVMGALRLLQRAGTAHARLQGAVNGGGRIAPRLLPALCTFPATLCMLRLQ